MSLDAFLGTKPLYYDKIDLERMPRAYDEVAVWLKLGTVVHVVGTNGKGSTGRMLATLLRDRGRVGHYSSPHILRFNERVWIDGADASDATLEAAHEKLQAWLRPETAEALSYFEYTTLLALVAFEGLDYVVLEAGLGGEFDATNVVPKELSVITPIGMDHQAFLGDTIEAIAATKLRSIGRRALLAPQPFKETERVAEAIARQKGAKLLHPDDIVRESRRRDIERIAASAGWPPFLAQNALTAAAAYALLTGSQPPPDRLSKVRLKGRFERIAPHVILDVGHNPLGAEAVRRALGKERRVLVYNALADKDVGEILKILKPVVKRLEILPIESDRAMEEARLRRIAEEIGIETVRFSGIDEKERYLVFGSFVVAEAFVKRCGIGG